MPVASDFRLHHSNALDVLAALLAEEVAAAPADGDWLRPDVVLVPQASMRRWLQQALAEQLGICANLRLLTPGEFVDLALDANLGPAPAADRLAPDSLRWRLLQVLKQKPPAALAPFLQSGQAVARDPLQAWSLANALAETYEKYQAWRGDWLLAWERAAPAGDWQASLWRAVARGHQHRARRVGAYLQRFGVGGEAPIGLPPRLFVFACQNVSPDVLQIIASQARAGSQHFYLHTPSRAFWGDLGRWARDYTPGGDDGFLGADHNPLLAAWGRSGRDFIATLGSGEAVAATFETTAFAEPPAHTLLGRLQADMLDNRAPLADNADTAWPRAEVDRHDASLQFHACHTRLREVQVLHDQLRALLEAPAPTDGQRLQPRDIVVLAPDIDVYAPHIEAVFGGALGSDRELPYTIADGSALASAPLAEAFLRVLELPLRAPSVADVLDLLAVPAIAARFDIGEADRASLQDWLEAAGARWGLDGQDRARHGGDANDAYTLAFALERLLLGYASGSEHAIAGIAPCPRVEGQASDALDALLRFVQLLQSASARLQAAQSPGAWQQTLNTLLDDLFAPERDGADAAVLRRLREALAAFAIGAQTAGYDAPVEHAVLLDWLRGQLQQADARSPLLGGGVCFGRMVPMRLIPFQVVCLLGMDADSFPARDARDSINRIVRTLDTRERRVGDPSHRDADRYLFLQLFASAGRVLSVSWCGMDPRDQSRREPSAVISELLDAAVRYHAGPAESVRDRLVVRHALQPFAPAAFGAPHAGDVSTEPEPRRFSYDARWRAAAQEIAGTRVPSPFAPAPLRLAAPLRDSPIVTLDQLRRALQRPHAVYLQEGLNVRLPEEEAPLPEHEPLGAAEGLALHHLRHAIFDACLQSDGAIDVSQLHARLLARALVASGPDGRATVATALDDVTPFVAIARDAGFAAQRKRLPFALQLGAHALHGTLTDVHPRGLLRVVLNAGGLHGGHVVRHGLERLCAALCDLSLHELAVPSKDAAPVLTIFPPLADDVAHDALVSLLAARDAALRAPLVFLPKAGLQYVRTLRDRGDMAAALNAARDCWAGSEWQADLAEAGPATRVALRGRDPFLDQDMDSQRQFARLATEIFAALAGQSAVTAEALA
jgi:exodeoxyribonuclease V gamma subunit